MYFGLSQVEFGVIAFPHCQGQVKDTGLGFKSQAQAGSKIGIADVRVLAIVSPPAGIRQQIEIRILANEIVVL